MKNKLLLLIVATFALTLHATQVIDLKTGQIVNNVKPLAPEKKVEKCENGLIITYKFSHATIEADTVYPGTFIVSLQGFDIEDQAGYPSIAKGMDTHFVPLNSNPKIEVIKNEYITLSYNLAPARMPQPASFSKPYTKGNVIPINAFSGYWPNSFCKELPIGRLRNQNIAKAEITPVLYNMETENIKVLTELQYKVSFTPQPSLEEKQTKSDYVINPNFVSPLSDGGFSREPGYSVPANAGYLIFSVPEFESALQEFINWKQQLGYNVKALYDANWDSTKIANCIKKLYWKDDAHTKIDSDFNLSYLLFVGCDSLVPAGRHSYHWKKNEIEDQFYLTDLPYACMDGANDPDPDIYRGRWPVSFESEVIAISDKAIQYEHMPPYDAEFYRTGTHFAFFEDGGPYEVNDGEEDGRFVKTSEDVYNYLTSHYGYNINRIYTIDTTKVGTDGKRHWPQKWSHRFSEGDSIPNYMLKENGFNWEQTNHDLNRAINNGTSYLLVSGHGYDNSWAWGTNMWYAYYDVMWLKNKEKLPLIFNLNCLTGNFNSYKCLMRQFLSNPNGGAIGAFASSHVTYYSAFATLAQYFTNAIWPNPGLKLNNGLSYSPINQPYNGEQHSIQQLGVLLDNVVYNLKTNNSTQNFTRRTFHCFGDPSMYFRTEEPEIINPFDFEITRMDTGVNVYLKDKEAFIAFYDPVTNTSKRYYGTEASYFSTGHGTARYVDVSIYTPNSIPYTDFGEQYTGIITSDTDSSRLTGFRSNYNGTTAAIDYYISGQDKNKKLEILIVDMNTGDIISSHKITSPEPDKKSTINIYCRSGLMTASLMVDGHPVSNIKAQIKL